MAAGNSEKSSSEQKMEIDISEFMDVIYTYKCKFCTFMTTDSPTFTNHVVDEHMQHRLQPAVQTIEKPQTSAVSTSTETQTALSEGEIKSGTSLLILGSKITPKRTSTSTTMTSSVEEAVPEEPRLVIEPQGGESAGGSQEDSLSTEAGSVHTTVEMAGEQPSEPGSELRELFLCGQCNLGFTSIEECKSHMMQDHNVALATADLLPGPSETESPGEVAMPANMISVATQSHAHKKPGRKRKSEIAAQQKEQDESENKISEELDFKMEAPVSLFNMRDTEDPGKRKINPPKSLTEDYYLGSRKPKKRREPREPYNMKCAIPRCLAKFKTAEARQLHLDCHIDVKEQTPGKMFKCVKCESAFLNWKLTAKHMWKEHAIDADLHKCYMCDFRADTLQKLETHEQVHSDQKPFVCNTCGKGFRQAAQLTNHQVIHLKGKAAEGKNSSEKWYNTKQCGICNRTFSNVKSMRTHIETVHEKVKPFKCTYCGHTTARKAMLLLHLRTHTGEKPYKCDLCTYITSDHNTLRRHRMRHTGQKPYKCPYCPYSCIQAISLKTHMKNKHPGLEGIFSCDSCQYQTVSKSNWEQHMEDHRNGLISDLPLEDSSDRQRVTTAGNKKSLPRTAGSKGLSSATTDESVKETRPVMFVTSTEQEAMSSAVTIPSIASSANFQSMLSLANSSGTQVLYYDPVTQQLSTGMSDGNPQSQTIVMTDDDGKDLIVSNTSDTTSSVGHESIQVQHLQGGQYTVAPGQGEVLLTVGEDDAQSTSLIPEGSIIYTQEAEQGQQTLTLQSGDVTQLSEELHITSEQGELPAMSESTGLHHILTAIQNMSEESGVPGSANTTQTDQMDVGPESVDETNTQERYVIEISQ